MTLARLLGLATVAVATVVAAVVWALGGPGLAGVLADDAPAYAVAIVWVTLAPVPLLVALVATLRTPWPWVAVSGVHLVVLTAAVARLRHLAPGPVWLGVGATVVLGIASAVAFAMPGAARAETRQR